MRGILVALLVFGSLPVIVIKPHVGVLVWSWIGYMNPQTLTWGFAYDFPFAMVVGVVTIAAWLFSREPKILPWHPVVLLLAVFAAWISFTTLFAAYPDHAQVKWDTTIKVLLFNGFVTLGLITTRRRLDALIWVIVLSIGYYAVRGGIGTLVTGGRYPIWGPQPSFFGDNNALGLVLLMIIPLIRYLQLSTQSRWLRSGLFVLMLFYLIAVLGTHSRGALVGLAVTGVALAVKSRRRIPIALAAGIALAGAMQLMPEHWHSRMGSIFVYAEDPSAQGRLDSWRYGVELAREHPFVGGGFEAFRGNEKPTLAGYAAAHSIYFEVLGEHGFVGLTIFLVLGIAAYRTAGTVARRGRKDGDLHWAADLGSMIQVSLIAYAAAGLFLNLATFDLYYHLIAVIVIAHCLVRQKSASRDRVRSTSGYERSTEAPARSNVEAGHSIGPPSKNLGGG